MTDLRDPQQIEKEVLMIISDRLGLPLNNIAVDAHLFEDLNASFLEKADIIQTLEEKYQIKFDSANLKSLNTISSIIEYIIDNAD